MSNVERPNFGGDKSHLYAIYNSRGDEHIIVANSESVARYLARFKFDLVRTHNFISKKLPKNYLEKKFDVPFSEALEALLRDGGQGKIRVEYSGLTLPKATAYFYAYGSTWEKKL